MMNKRIKNPQLYSFQITNLEERERGNSFLITNPEERKEL